MLKRLLLLPLYRQMRLWLKLPMPLHRQMRLLLKLLMLMPLHRQMRMLLTARYRVPTTTFYRSQQQRIYRWLWAYLNRRENNFDSRQYNYRYYLLFHQP
nr:hypothetical protein [uncultured Erwinia sp.]